MQRRVHSLDYIKILFALLVVFGHSNWMQAVGLKTDYATAVFVLGNGLLRLMVPMFCVISGYFIHAKVTERKGFRSLRRLFLIYLALMVVYAPLWLDTATNAWEVFRIFLWGFFHLWFLIGIVIGGAVVVMLNTLARRWAPDRIIAVLLVPALVCAVIGVVLQYLSLSESAAISVPRFRNGLFFCYPFLAIGFVIAELQRRGDRFPTRRKLAFAASLGVVAVVFEALIGLACFGPDVSIDILLTSYIAVPPLFLLCLQVRMPPQPLDLGLITASIYFLHIWAFRLAAALDIHSLAGLMVIGAGVPTLLALAYAAIGGAISQRLGLGRNLRRSAQTRSI